jgi:hypothetical protein
MNRDHLILVAVIVGSTTVAALAAFVVLDDELMPRVPHKAPTVAPANLPAFRPT